MIAVIWTLVALLVVFIYKLVTKDNEVFKRRGVAYEKPIFFFGNMLVDLLMGTEGEPTVFNHLYERFSREKIFGVFMLHRPIFVLRDNHLVKQITDEHSDAFQCCSVTAIDKSIGKAYSDINQLGTQNTFNPELVNANRLHQRFLRSLDNFRSSEKLETSVNELAENFVGGSIAEIFFEGLENTPEIVKLLKSTDLDLVKSRDSLKFLIKNLMPKKIQTLCRDSIEVLSKTLNNIKSRRNLNCENKPKLVDEPSFCNFPTIASKWFVATTKTLEKCLKLLVNNSDFQDELIGQIQKTRSRCQNASNIQQIINSIELLEATVVETFRMCPSAALETFLCTKDCAIATADELFIFKRNDFLKVPRKLIQYDAKNFQNPSEFDPHRFISDPSRRSLIVGSSTDRFDLLHVKVFIFNVLTSYRMKSGSANCIILVPLKT